MIPETPGITAVALLVAGGLVLFGMVSAFRKRTGGRITAEELAALSSAAAAAATLLNESALRWRAEHSAQEGPAAGEPFPTEAYSPLLWKNDARMTVLLDRLKNGLERDYYRLPLGIGNNWRLVRPLFDLQEPGPDDHESVVRFLLDLRAAARQVSP